MIPPEWHNPGVRSGILAMLESRSRLVEAGERMIGWKLAFGARVWLERFGLSGPLLGYLSDSRRHPSGAVVPCSGWANPVAEPEIALQIGQDVDDPSMAAQSISGLGPAIELADVDPPPDDLESVLAGNIFHRAVILGAIESGRDDASTDGLRAEVARGGVQVADTTDLETLTGKLGAILVHAASLLAAAGETMRSGEVVIMGSVVQPVPVQPGDEVIFRLDPLPPISVRV